MKNVLVLIHTPTFGGPHNQVLRLGHPLMEKGYKLFVVLPEESEESSNRLENSGIKVIKAPLKRIRRPSLWRNNLNYLVSFKRDVRLIQDLIKEYDIDIVQVCGLMHLHGAFAAKKTDKHLVWQLLSSTFIPRPLRDILCIFVKKFANTVMVVGKKTLMHHPFYKSFNNVKIFYPPVNEVVFRKNSEIRTSLRKTLNLSEDTIVIGTVGNRVKPKAHERIVRLIDDIVTSEQDVHFIIAGNHDESHSGYYQSEVLDSFANINHEDHCTFIEKFNVEEILNTFDIFLLSSRSEGLPTVVLEAICCELPIVSTRVGSIEEVVDETNGIIVYNYDHYQMTNALHSLIENNDLRFKLSGGSARKKSTFYLESCVEKHVEAYEGS